MQLPPIGCKRGQAAGGYPFRRGLRLTRPILASDFGDLPQPTLPQGGVVLRVRSQRARAEAPPRSVTKVACGVAAGARCPSDRRTSDRISESSRVAALCNECVDDAAQLLHHRAVAELGERLRERVVVPLLLFAVGAEAREGVLAGA